MSDSKETDCEILELLLSREQERCRIERERRKQTTHSFASGGGKNAGKLENIKLEVCVMNKVEVLRKRFSGDNHVSDIAQATIDQICGDIDIKSMPMDLHYCGKRLKMDQLLSSLEGIKGDEGRNLPIFVLFRVHGGGGEVVISDNKEFTADEVHTYDILKITGKDAKVSVKGWDKKTGTGGKLLLHCHKLILEGGASINVDGKGYSGGDKEHPQGYSIGENKLRFGKDSNEMLNKSNNGGGGMTYSIPTVGANSGGGGGYGGPGKCGGGGLAQGGGTYGNAKQFELNGHNVYLGSGGGCDADSGTWRYGGNGGGVVVIKCDDAIIIENGCTISANGTRDNTYGGGGSGGSVYLHAPNIVNNGKVTAIGGSPTHGGSGGFGRIRVDCNKEHQKQLGNNANFVNNFLSIFWDQNQANFNPKIEYFGCTDLQN